MMATTPVAVSVTGANAGICTETFAGSGIFVCTGVAGVDTLTFAGSSGAVTGATVVNWENVVIGTGSTISFADNALSAGSLTINAGG